MLPSMPILFTRESQDAFGNKIEPSTSFSKQNWDFKPAIEVQANLCKVEEKSKLPNEQEKSGNVENNEEKHPKIVDNPLEAALVKSYFSRVQSRLTSSSSVPTKNKFTQFREILKSFDPSKETPVDLYKKIEEIFGTEHKDLLEEFLLFLKPGQAVEVGRFMDHFMLVQITGFIKLLQNTFSRKPTVLRKVLRAITTSINSGRSEDIKTRVLPHLRSNPRLAQMFKSLFPDERPPDSLYNVGVDNIEESFLMDNHSYEFWEFVDETGNKRRTDVKEGLRTEYLHGRVFLQHGRLLRTARVTYPYSKEPYRSHIWRLAPDHYLPPLESERDRLSPKRNSKSNIKIPPKRTRKQLKSPTKNVKDVNDNTKRDCHIINSKSKARPPKGKNTKKDDIKKKDKVETKNTCTKKDDKNIAKQKNEIKVENKSWTREEDKIMLEVLKGGPGSDQVFAKINQLLPHRSPLEIKERFCHVMTLLQQMAVGNVT